MLPVIFTDFRREMIARTLFDILKITLIAGFASKFFLEFPKVVQLVMVFWIVTLGVLGILTCPMKKPKD